MIETTKRGHRFAASAVLAVGGAALALATWRSGDGGFAVALAVFYAIAAIVAWFWAVERPTLSRSPCSAVDPDPAPSAPMMALRQWLERVPAVRRRAGHVPRQAPRCP